MKLRNLMYATMIACAFASCSNDDVVPAPDQGGVNNDGTTLSLQIEAPALTKADDVQINSLSMLVFDINGQLEAIGKKEGEYTTEQVTVKGGTKKVMVLANVGLPEAVKLGAAYEAVIAALNKDFNAEDATEITDNLTMSSKLYEGVEVAIEKRNMLGYSDKEIAEAGGVAVGGVADAKEKVKLYRNVAKIVLTSIKTKEYYGDNEGIIAYKEPKLQATSVFLLQGSKKTLLYSTDEYSVTEMSDEGFLFGKAGYVSAEGDKYTLASYSEDDVYEGYNFDVTDWEDITGTVSTPNTTFYAYENTSEKYQTLLVVAGTFSYKNANDEYVDVPDRYYTVAIGADNAVFSETAKSMLAKRSVDDPNGVYRNLEYKVNLTVVGPGYKTPTGGSDPTTLEAQVEVVAYGEVTQDVEI